MQRKFSSLPITVLAFFSVILWSCTKIDTTELGGDLIPAVDNITTFADTLFVDASREAILDSTKLSRSETHVLGSINNDPVFGKTKADLFLELKPSFFPFYFGKSYDTINPIINNKTHFDSAFLCLSYAGFYGDSTKPQHFKVYQLAENNSNFVDTISHPLNFQPNQPYLGNLIGEATINQTDLKNYVYLKNSAKDSITNQIRIKLNPSFLNFLVSRDSSTSSSNNQFHSDSTFKVKFKGFAVVADGTGAGNGLFYVSLTDAKTRLEVHYVASNTTLDTAYTSFPLSTGSTATVTASANANHIARDTSSSEFPNSQSANALYIQSTPGSAIKLKIPALSQLTNRIIHRAELIIEQIPGSAGNDVFSAPNYLYLDLKDDTSTTTKYKPLYFDLSPTTTYYPDNSTLFFPTQGIDYTYYGGYLRTVTDGLGTRSFYNFNLTRYVQNLATNGGTNYQFRVYAPYNLNYYGLSFNYKNNLAFGRVKIGSGTNAQFKLRMRIVYSKL